MENRRKTIFIIIIAALLFSSAIIFPLIFFFFNGSDILIQVIPSSLKSYPGHTAWIIGEIQSKNSLINNKSIQIESNESVEINYKIWDNSNKEIIVEVFVKPNNTHLNKYIEVQVSFNDEKIYKRKSIFIEVIDWEAKNITSVLDIRDIFISYFSSNLTLFGINESTIWEGIDSAPQTLVVEHYLFKSVYWELELSRHMTTPPYDWIKVYLRPRNQTKPIWAGMIESWNSGNYTIIPIEPPLTIYR